MADKRIFQLEEEGFLDDITDKVYMWLDKKANEGELQEPSWKFKANVFLKILNNFATKFVPNVATVEGKCYWHNGQLFVCNVAYTGDWVPGNFTLTSVDELFARKYVLSALQEALETTNGNVTALTTYAQNVAHSIAPEFDPAKPNDAGGYAYYAGEIVSNNGTTYRFKVNHSSGAWNPAEVERYVAGESLKFFVVTDNPEYLYAVVDNNARFLFGVKVDGSFEWASGVPSVLKETIDTINDALLGKVDKEEGKSLIDSVFAEAQSSAANPEYVYAVTDSEGRLLFAIDREGGIVAFTKINPLGGIDWTPENLTDLERALKAHGFTSGQGDWSDDSELKIPMPKFALLNFSNISSFPTTKTDDLQAVMEFWDMNGNYFKKKVILNAQGNSSLAYPKKNLAIDICNDDWVGDDTFKLKIGDWVTQDSFHIKAFYTDYFRGTGEIGYSLYKEILDTRGIKKNRSWKLALVSDNDNYGQGLGYGAETSETLRIDDGALCFPEGFPCLVYLNGSFNGIYAFQLKKHRDNYMMKKDNKKHIHLDGVLNTDFFCGTIDWTAFEVRNPKNLYCMDGTKYDGDNPKELIDPTSASYNPNNSKHVNTYAVKQSIIALSQVYSLVSAASTDEEKKAIVEEYFNVDNLIDYQIFCDLIYNVDGVAKNWQWTTWDGHKWFANAYDLDMSFGAMYTGDVIHKPATSHVGVLAGLPNTYILSLYSGDLEARYAELRNNGVADAERIAAKFDTWVKSIGADAFKKEWELWNDSPCNRDMVINTDYWDISLTDGKPDIVYATQGHSVYSSSVTYSAGDEVIYCPTAAFTSQGWWYVFTCKASCSGEAPVTKPGFRDNLWRVKNWLAKTVENMDTLYNYSNQ